MIKFLRIVLRIMLVFLAIPVLWLTVAKIIRRLFPFPAPAIIGYALDTNLRRKLQPSDQIIERSGIIPGNKVLNSPAYSSN